MISERRVFSCPVTRMGSATVPLDTHGPTISSRHREKGDKNVDAFSRTAA